jgi:hypothetical protein
MLYQDKASRSQFTADIMILTGNNALDASWRPSSLLIPLAIQMEEHSTPRQRARELLRARLVANPWRRPKRLPSALMEEKGRRRRIKKMSMVKKGHRARNRRPRPRTGLQNGSLSSDVMATPSKLRMKKKVEVALLPGRPKKTWMERQSTETAYLVDLCISDFRMANGVTQFTWQDQAHLGLN